MDHDDILPPYYVVNTNNPLYVWGYLFLTPGNLIVKEDYHLSFLYLNKKTIKLWIDRCIILHNHSTSTIYEYEIKQDQNFSIDTIELGGDKRR